MYLDEYGRKVYIEYELAYGIKVSDEFIYLLKNNKNLPYFFNSIHFIQKLYNSYGDERITNIHINEIYKMSSNTSLYYYNLEIPKRDGNTRTLTIPNDELKHIQKYINKNIFTWYKPSIVASAYISKRGIKYNARLHVKSNYILKLDIHDFFGSIHFGKVVNNILPKEYPQELRTLISNLCLYKGYLPQGAPTSPTISNIVMNKFDEIMIEFSKSKNIVFTRYADDMTFSSVDYFNPNIIMSKVKYLLDKYYKMSLNEEKTIFLHNGLKQNICGVIVNSYMQVSKEYRDKIRQEIYYLNKYGIDKHIYSLYYDKKIPKLFSKSEYYSTLLGKINYVLSINPNDQKFIEYKNEIKGYIKSNNENNNLEFNRIKREALDLSFNYDTNDKIEIILNLIQNRLDIDLVKIDFDFIFNRNDAIIDRIYDVGICNYFQDGFKNFIEGLLKAKSLKKFETNQLYAYTALVYYLNFGESDYDKYKYYANVLKNLGNYRGIYLIAVNDAKDENEKLELLKEASFGKDGHAQYEYAKLIKDKDTELYEKLILASANNYNKDAYFDAYMIYKKYNSFKEAIYLLKMASKNNNLDAIKEAKYLKENHLYKFSKKFSGFLNRH